MYTIVLDGLIVGIEFFKEPKSSKDPVLFMIFLVLFEKKSIIQ